jgi:hypothetical protein
LYGVIDVVWAVARVVRELHQDILLCCITMNVVSKLFVSD